MLDYLNVFIFGVVQGLTEFLPVSSSGHLVILHQLIDLPIKNELAFDVALHFATLLAVLFFFRTEVCKLIKNWFLSFKGESNEYSRLAWFIIIATIPAGLAALLFNDLIENYLRSPIVVAVMLLVVGVLFLIFERISAKQKNISDLNWRQSLLIGCAQAFALVPGTSRSGISIIAALSTGLKREEAVKFAFLVSIPIIFLAALKEVPQLFNSNLGSHDFILILVAFCSAALSGWLAIKYFLRFSKNNSLDIFAYYRFALAIFILIYFFW